MTPVKDTSILSYAQEQDRGLGHRQLRVYEAIQELNREGIFPTDREIAELLGKADPNFVRPRRFELVQLGYVKMHGKKRCSVTGKLAYSWTVV